MNSLKSIVLATLLVLLMNVPASAQSESLKALVADKFTVWQEGTGSPFELLADSIQWRVEGEGPQSGTFNKEQFLEELVIPFNAKLATPLMPIEFELFQDGNTVIVLFSAEAELKSGGSYINRYVWIMHFVDEKIVKVNAFLNLPAFERVMDL
ncbi:hypothetical protein NJR55_11705 [Idiomarina sp. M1R2S28]|uniref:Ketosteroid isomerase n=1 Tax=Idiomarina rhizosphaerae TaxID=2961572 RepID=A0A9X2G4J0_9GAMM|nr:hypothetical protein [Idiomarina rhizosphaerae]MCP1340253.1 hypothetical protein [Idiomarina rhizosphaerae]